MPRNRRLWPRVWTTLLTTIGGNRTRLCRVTSFRVLRGYAEPMDLRTMKNKLEGGEYARPEALRRDFELIYRNCASFNAEGAVIVTVARQIKDLGSSWCMTHALRKKIRVCQQGAGRAKNGTAALDKALAKKLSRAFATCQNEEAVFLCSRIKRTTRVLHADQAPHVLERDGA